ncbi:MAG: hypothetical protein MI923_16510 [Phycisphaerales bacterium]|nr:hypothetical protein [Phycisphaerales bacterium]
MRLPLPVRIAKRRPRQNELRERLLTTSLIIAGTGLAAVMAATISLRRRRTSSQLRNLARKHGWEIVLPQTENWAVRLCDVPLMQVGHSRRVGPTLRPHQGLWLFPYVFETGFEHRRDTHTWRFVICDVEHHCGRALITRQDWLIAAATSAATDKIHLTQAQSGPNPSPGSTALVEDYEEWLERLEGTLKNWLTQQPKERTWEFLPNTIVGYEPGEFHEDALVALADSATELARRWKTVDSNQESSDSSASDDGAELTVG